MVWLSVGVGVGVWCGLVYPSCRLIREEKRGHLSRNVEIRDRRQWGGKNL